MKSLTRLAIHAGLAVFLAAVLGYAVVLAQPGQRICGNEGELACGVFERDLFNGACDAGLQSRLEVCGCLLRGPFGNCLIPSLCRKCRNDTRHRPGLAAQFQASWAEWALSNQREQLAVDEPLNWVMHLGTHNAFNSYSDGHQPRLIDLVGTQIVDAPNHFYSMTDQLNLGSRLLALDTYWVQDNARLCHSFSAPTADVVCLTPSIDLDGDLFPSMRYFANGVEEIKNWLASNPEAIVVLNLENYVDYTTCEGAECDGDGTYISGPLNAYLGSKGWLLAGSAGPLPSRAEMLAEGKRVVVVFNGRVAGGIGFDEDTVVDGGYQFWLRNNQDFVNCVGNYQGAQHGPAVATRDKFTVVVEDRTLQQFINPDPFGHLSTTDLAQVARCNYTIVATDFLGSAIPLGRSSDRRDFSRHEALVWSWKPGDRGQFGDCAAFEAASGRWTSADCQQPRRYACAPPRSESGTSDRTNWHPREQRWRITQAMGPWDGGPAACAAEFPYDPADGTAYVFSVPVNGAQNAAMMAANADGDDLWMNYTDQVREGSWAIPRLPAVNAAPIADAGLDGTIECGNTSTLDGTGSVDPDGDGLTYTWSGPFGTLSGPSPTVTLGSGVHVVTLTVEDGKGGVGTDSVTITVADTRPPSLSVALSPWLLSPIDGDLVRVAADVRAQDACDDTDVLVELRTIASSEPDTDPNARDIQDAQIGTGDLEFLLRAERTNAAMGRRYKVIYIGTDSAGNATEIHQIVVVPHDKVKAQGKSPLP